MSASLAGLPFAGAARRAEPPLAMVTLTVMLGMIMAIIDTSIVNVALGTMAGNLGASTDEIAWVATGYILANVIVITNAAIPIGMLMKKMSGHDALSTIQPPSTGPIAGPTIAPRPKIAIPLARFSGGYDSNKIACAVGCSAPPPKP